MTDAGIPMGREQQAREVLAATPHDADCPENPKSWSFRNRRRADPYPCVCDRQVRAMLAFADTPPPAAAGDRSLGIFERDDQCNVEFNTVPDCDCPHEHWHVNGVCLDVHIEEDRTGHIILTLEDDPIELQISGVADLAEARAIAFAWAAKRLCLALRTPEPNSGGEETPPP